MKVTVLVAAEVGKVDEIEAKLLEKSIGEVTVVAGIYDLLLTIEIGDPEHYRNLILDFIHHLDGVEDTITLLHLS